MNNIRVGFGTVFSIASLYGFFYILSLIVESNIALWIGIPTSLLIVIIFVTLNLFVWARLGGWGEK